MAQHFGCVRWVYNWARKNKIRAYKAQNKDPIMLRANPELDQKGRAHKYELSRQLTQLKKRHALQWLNEINSQSLVAAIHHLDSGMQHFFRRVKQGGVPGFPRKKYKDDNKSSFECPQHTTVNQKKGFISIPKIPFIKTKIHRNFEGKTKMITISKTASGKYYASVLVEEKGSLPKKPKLDKKKLKLVKVNQMLKQQFLENKLKRLKVLQRRLSRKQHGGKNYEKARIKLAKLHELISNQRGDFLHNQSKTLIKKHKHIKIKEEKIAEKIKKEKHKQNKRRILDRGAGEFKRQLQYKGEWYGANVIVEKKKKPDCRCGGCIDNALLAAERCIIAKSDQGVLDKKPKPKS